MPKLSRDAVAVVDAAVGHDSTAYARPDREHHGMLTTTCCTDLELSEHGHVRVIVDNHRDTMLFFQHLAEGYASEVQEASSEDMSVTLSNAPSDSDADPRHSTMVDRVRSGKFSNQCVDTTELRLPPGSDALRSKRSHLTVLIHAGHAQVGAPKIDADSPTRSRHGVRPETAAPGASLGRLAHQRLDLPQPRERQALEPVGSFDGVQ